METINTICWLVIRVILILAFAASLGLLCGVTISIFMKEIKKFFKKK